MLCLQYVNRQKMWKSHLFRLLRENKMVKKMKIYTLSTIIMCICGGCGVKKQEITSLATDISSEIHQESTLSTDISTNVDNFVGFDEDKCTTMENIGSETVDKGDETGEYVDNSVTDETIEQINDTEETSSETGETSSQTQETSLQAEESSLQTEETYSQTEESINSIMEEAQYYSNFYSITYKAVTGKEPAGYEKSTFRAVYKSISEESLSDYFSDISWITREEGISLSLTPREILFPESNKNELIWMARCIHAFEMIESEYSADENWDNPESLRPQFHCHAIYARQEKMPWNIEPFRTETDFIKIIISKGNPA